MINLYQSIDLTTLAKKLLEMSQGGGVFEKTRVVVPNLAAADWLQQRMARETGCAAQLDFIFWAEFERRILETVFGKRAAPAAVLYSDTALRWRLFGVLLQAYENASNDSAHPLAPLLAPMLGSAQGARAEKRLWAFAGETARIFSDYIAMRSDWLDAWSEGDVPAAGELFAGSLDYRQQPDWMQAHTQTVLTAQSYLWQETFAGIWNTRRALLAELGAMVQQGKITGFDRPLHVFTMASMTPEALSLLQRLSPAADIYLYHHSISNAEFADIADPRWLRQLPACMRESGHRTSGHALAARFGKSERALQRLLQERGLHENITVLEAPAKPAADTLLRHLQHDIVHMDDTVTLPESSGEPDDSLVVHSCRGFLRQLEVLRAEIVRWLNADSTRRLSDILITAPDISEYQDAVRAVFPAAGSYDGFYLPARLTGVSTPEAENLWLGTGGLYSLLQSGFDAQTVCSWLLLEENATAYGAQPQDMQDITSRLIDAGFKRGFSADNAPDGDDRFTFLYALDRLAAGFAMPGAAIYAESAVPAAGIAAGSFAAVNALCAFAQDCEQALAALSERKTAGAWLDVLQSRLTERYAAQADSNAYAVIAERLRDLRYELARSDSGADALLPVLFVAETIGEALSGRRLSSEPSGVITIGRLAALRALPYKLIAFIGAREGEFPSYDSDLRYNLIRIDKPRAGDRSRENDELGAFLQILTSAEQSCWLFYDTGEEDSENAVPPMPIQEVISHYRDAGENLLPVIHHEDAPYHPDQGQLRAAPLWHSVAKALQSGGGQARPWAAFELPEDLYIAAQRYQEGAPVHLTLEELTSALLKPASTYLAEQAVAQLYLPEAPARFAPLKPNHLEKWQLTDHLLKFQQDDAVLSRLPLLPAGSAGRAVYQTAVTALAARKEALLEAAGEDITPVAPVQLRIGEDTISARVPERAGTWVQISASRISNAAGLKIKHLLRLWLQHLCHQLAAGGDTLCSYESQEPAGELLRLPALDKKTAHDELAKWLAIYKVSKITPWLMPPELGWEAVKKDSAKTAKRFLDTSENGMHKIDSQDAWDVIFQGRSEAELLKTLTDAADKYQHIFNELKTAAGEGQ